MDCGFNNIVALISRMVVCFAKVFVLKKYTIMSGWISTSPIYSPLIQKNITGRP